MNRVWRYLSGVVALGGCVVGEERVAAEPVVEAARSGGGDASENVGSRGTPAEKLPYPLEADLAGLDGWWSAPWPVATRVVLPEKGARSLADAVVVERSAEGVVLKSTLYLNADQVELVQRWTGLSVDVPAGARIPLGQSLGPGAGRLDLTLDGVPVDPSAWISRLPKLFDPHAEPAVAVMSLERYGMILWRSGVEIGRYAVSFGQAKGAKEHQGDNRTPRGMYFVTGKSTGPFGEPYGAYYGGFWTKLNYPNPWDAARGLEAGWVTPERAAAITKAWSARALTSQSTRLGGGIGLHGWAEEWDDADSRHKSWGCVVFHLRDVEAVYQALPVGSMVVIR